MEKIGLIGVGLMGHGIGLNVAKGGRQLSWLDHPGNQPTEDLAALGARKVSDLAGLAAASDAIILCVTGSPQVEAIVLGEDGLLPHLGAGQVLIDCSTARPRSTIEVAEAVRATGCAFVDAPMTRTPKEAAEGRLNLLVGASDADFATVLPLLQSFSEVAKHVGPVGSGHQMKLLHNYVSIGSAVLMAEAAACARKCGLDAEVFCEVLQEGGGRGATLERLLPFITTGEVANFRFSLSNGAKDLGYYAALAEGEGASDGVARAVRALLDAEIEAGNGARMMPELVALLDR
ncbi:NAD(P)-dependent oxidoreductase (plasmid) [Paroceanicella profunda]|uniref:NAD(P)-dependent oxidoreductase n=1 Tax=Paroceanicella profunda TaxID=2579971 RepID=A0A5B8G4U9_9RHOB|nr:NAD(P)-dependent oxidoreductase [Paroceanicella profunda]QDL94302.1 NAD(P)-dependent oxidoreductase [Paroceanicella profunda]